MIPERMASPPTPAPTAAAILVVELRLVEVELDEGLGRRVLDDVGRMVVAFVLVGELDFFVLEESLDDVGESVAVGAAPGVDSGRSSLAISCALEGSHWSDPDNMGV